MVRNEPPRLLLLPVVRKDRPAAPKTQVPRQILRKGAAAARNGAEKTAGVAMSAAANLTQPLPNNLDAERLVLGAILVDNSALARVRDVLTPSDFFLEQNRKIFVEMLTLNATDRPIDLVVLTDELHKKGELEASGGAPYLSALADGMPKVSNVVHYARMIVEKSYLRRVIHYAHSLQQAAFAGDADAATIADNAIVRIQQLKITSGENRTNSFFDTFEEFESAPPLSFAVEGFLQNDGITGIAGLSGDGKTWTALSAGRALLFGPGRLWDLFVVPERAEKVIYLIPESTRTAFKHRLKLTGLYDEIRTGRLMVRTLSKGPTPSLTDASLLHQAKGAHIFVDTAVRFIGEVDESSGSDIAEGLSKDFLALLRAEARTVIPLFHSPKSFVNQNTMCLENMIRGSSEFGAVLASAWGIRQIDEKTNTVHIQNLKPRDFEPCGPFQIVGRPHIDQEGDFRLLKAPGECGTLAEESSGGAENDLKRDERIRRVAIAASWLAEDSNISSREMVDRFKAIGVAIDDSTARRYRTQARKGGAL